MNIGQIAMCYISINSSQRALQNIEKLFSKFKLAFEFWLKSDFFAEKRKIFKGMARRDYCHISMNSSR